MQQSTPQLDDQIKDFLKAWSRRGYQQNMQLKDIPAGKAILRASPKEQCHFVMIAIAWVQEPRHRENGAWSLMHALSQLLRRALPFDHDDVLTLLRWTQSNNWGYYIEPHLMKVLKTYFAKHPRTPALEEALVDLVEVLKMRTWSTAQRQRLSKLKVLAGIDQIDTPFLPNDVWADTARAEIMALEADPRSNWVALLQHCVAVIGSAPSEKWRKAAQALVEPIGAAEFRATLQHWLPLVDRPRTTPIIEA